MIKTIFKELTVYNALFLVLAAGMHPDFFSAPLERFALMTERQNYIHPFVYTLVAYLFISIIRIFIRVIFRLLKIYKTR